MNIEEKYGIQFSNVILDFESGSEISKVLDINNDTLGEFFIGWHNAGDINEELLPDIEEGLRDPDAVIDNGSETVFIRIHQQQVQFEKDGPEVLLEMPLADFKEITLLWRDFLQTPPLRGSRV